MSDSNNYKTVSPRVETTAEGEKACELPADMEAKLTETEDIIDELQRLDYDSDEESRRLECFDRVWIWGVPFARVAMNETLDLVDRLVEQGRPELFITANLHYAMLTDRHSRLRIVNARAAFILADGMPMVWYSRLKRKPLPERIAGSDLIFKLCQRAAERGHRVFLLGGGPGIAEQAAENLCRKYPDLQIAGVEAPPMLNKMNSEEHQELIVRVRRSKSDLLLVAFGQPKGEMWLAENCQSLGVPVCVQLGASFDFVAGRVQRAPKWIQRIGMEWLYRISREPFRMAPRYFQDGLFLLKALARDAAAFRSFRRSDKPNKRS